MVLPFYPLLDEIAVMAGAGVAALAAGVDGVGAGDAVHLYDHAPGGAVVAGDGIDGVAPAADLEVVVGEGGNFGEVGEGGVFDYVPLEGFLCTWSLEVELV